MNTLFKVIGILFAIDMIGFVMWGMSGQMPVDGFFVGMITRFIINLFI